MKLNLRYLFLAFLFIPFILLSCKTTGTDTSSLTEGVQQDLEGPADENTLSALAQAREKAEESRSWAEYVNGDVYCPDEWTLAEDRYAAADERDEPETKGEALAMIAEWNGIKLVYDDIFNKSASQFAGEQERILAEARNDAVEAGAEELVPDRLELADAVAASSRQKFENGDVSGSIKEGKEAHERYLILQTLATARSKQEEADEYEFFFIDEENYTLAADAGNNAVDFYDEGRLAEAQAEANTALTGFRQVLRNGWSSMVEESAAEAREWRTASQEIKANVAVRSDFAAAEEVYNEAHIALRAEQYAEAIDLFEQSEELFMIAYDNAMEKRQRAEEALLMAEQMLAESEEKAQNAENIIGGDE